MESSDAKTVIKNIRRHIRLLNQKWLELHNKAERWCNQLNVGERNLEAINNLLNLSLRHLNEIDGNTQSWKSVSSHACKALVKVCLMSYLQVSACISNIGFRHNR